MTVKFEKYWSEFSLILAIAMVVDPRYKLQFVDWCYKKIYGVGNSVQFLHVKDKLFSTFDEYNQKSISCSLSSKSLDQEDNMKDDAHEGSSTMFRKKANAMLKVNKMLNFLY